MHAHTELLFSQVEELLDGYETQGIRPSRRMGGKWWGAQFSNIVSVDTIGHLGNKIERETRKATKAYDLFLFHVLRTNHAGYFLAFLSDSDHPALKVELDRTVLRLAKKRGKGSTV